MTLVKPGERSLVSIDYPELDINDRALDATMTGLNTHVGGGPQRGFHGYCGSARTTGLLTRWRGTWFGVDNDSALIGIAKERPLHSANAIGRFFFGADVHLAGLPAMSCKYSFRAETPARTSIRCRSISRCLVEFGLRDAGFDARALCEELVRIAIPGAPVVIVCYGPLAVNDWMIADALSPKLARLSRLRPSLKPFLRFGIRPLKTDGCFATGCFDLAQTVRHLDEAPEVQRLLGLRGWSATSFLYRELRRNWGRAATKRDVRRPIRIYVGKIPLGSNEQAADVR